MKLAFTGSFYPPHIGHKYVIDYAKSLGADVVVIAANNTEKNYTISLDSRVSLCRDLLNCEVFSSYAHNIGELIKRLGCNGILRGIRNTDDFIYEQQIAEWNLINNNLRTIFVLAPEELKNVSSTQIRNSCSR